MLDPSKPISVGVYIIPPVQFLDISPIDVIGSMSKEYVVDTPLPDSVKKHALDIQIKYITPSGPKKEPLARITSQAALRVDYSIHDPEAQPGKFDIILIPGPPPDATFTEEQLDFIRKHFADGKGATIMSVCTASKAVAESGIVNGRTGSAPRNMIPEFKKKFPKANWVDKRWARDDSGKLWMSGGVTNGQDMLAAFFRENYPGPFTDIVLALLDVGERGQEYGSGTASTAAWWIFAFLRSWLKGVKKTEKAKN